MDVEPQQTLNVLSLHFEQGISLQEIRAIHPPAVVNNPTDLAANFWPAEESIEDFLDFLRTQRQET